MLVLRKAPSLHWCRYMEKLFADSLDEKQHALIAPKEGMVRENEHSDGWRAPSCSFDYANSIHKSCARMGHALYFWQSHCHEENWEQMIQHITILKHSSENHLFQHFFVCNIEGLPTLRRCLATVRASPAVRIISVQNKVSLFMSAQEWRRQEEMLDFAESSGAELGYQLVFMAYSCMSIVSFLLTFLCYHTVLHHLAKIKRVSEEVIMLVYFRRRWPRCCLPLE